MKIRRAGAGWRYLAAIASAAAIPFCANSAFAQDAEQDDDGIEEIVVTGSQIRGARISGALPVSVINAETIEAFGIDSGDEMLDFMPENGNNFFNEAESISGGVNAARGDVGAFNLRSLGTGNTLVLLNGRRMVNNASYQTEEVGGSFVPVNTVNSNTIPVFGVDRVEVLREGASAIYGADAVAGVVNTVLKTDFEGLTVRTKFNEYANIPRSDQNLVFEWGKFFNDRKTNVGAFFNYYHRDRVNSQDDPRWANSDLMDRVPAGSPWEGDTAFRNDSANSLYGQHDIRSSVNPSSNPDRYGLIAAGVTDGSGEFETYPVGDERCSYLLMTGICGAPDGQGTYRYNMNDNRDISSELDRYSMFFYINHEFDNGVESFTEVGYYNAKTNLYRHPAASFSDFKLRVAADNYYNPFGPAGSPNRIDADEPGVVYTALKPDGAQVSIPAGGLELEIDNYRFAELPRIVDNKDDSYRLVQGFRWMAGDWDMESAVTWSKAEGSDITHNRISNILMQEALNDPTPAAYNPFSGGVDSNIERALIDVYRKSETELKMIDFKASTADLFELPGGAAGLLAGVELREESFVDNRDPRLDGTIAYTYFDGTTYPFVSDVVNSSPTPDNSGDRTVTSLFGELALPLHERLDVQVALRYEDFSDIGDTTVGKIAAGWRVFDPLLIRGSYSTGFRVPNLVTVNEDVVARQNTRTDWACQYVEDVTGDPGSDLTCRTSTQRIAQGSEDLVPEESTNYSVGFVLEPIENLTLTLDYWSIEKENTIGLFGEENHTLLDLVYLLEQGTANCASISRNDAVVRTDADPDLAQLYLDSGICPVGDVRYIEDRYKNLDKRTVEGIDLGVYYSWDTSFGDFDLRYVGSFLEKYNQEAGELATILIESQEAGVLPSNYPVAGFANLLKKNGNQEDRQNMSLGWRMKDWGASVSGFRIGSFYQDELTLSDGTRYNIPSMTTWNLTADYTFRFGSSDSRLRTRLGVNNVTDERAPLADAYFGYFADSHRDLGRYYYLDLRLSL